MPFPRERVVAIAALARLDLTDEEADRFAAQLSDILDHVADLEAADAATTGSDAPDAPTVTRPDEPGSDELTAPPSSFAPAWSEGFFTVPRLEAMGDEDGDRP